MSLLEVEGLTVEYSSGGYAVRPLDGFALSMERGQLGLLLGASGCGKSTLLSALAGLLSPHSGSIRVGDTELVGLTGNALGRYRQRSVGIVFQAFNLIPSLTARENVELPMLTAGLGRRYARHKAEELLEQVDLRPHTHKRPAQMSGGQQQRVAIARALALDPPLVLADEPTAHLDYIQVEGVLTILRQLADSSRIVLVATHDDRLLPLADRVVELTKRAAVSGAGREERRLAPGEVLFRQGDVGALVYVVESGSVALLRQRDNGSEEVVGEVKSGSYFGELAPLFGLPRSASAEATEPTTVTGLPLQEFRDRLANGSLAPPAAGAAVSAALFGVSAAGQRNEE